MVLHLSSAQSMLALDRADAGGAKAGNSAVTSAAFVVSVEADQNGSYG